MTNSILNAVANRFGFQFERIRVAQSSQRYEQYSYYRDDGSLEYAKYVKTQSAGNRRKIHKVCAIEENIEFLSGYIKSINPDPVKGICHGTRRGKEQEWFRKYLDCDVTGTEISNTATQFPHTIQWDFHEVKPDWIASLDFIYSNSLDHSYDPRKCISAWINCIRPGGTCILEHTSGHETATRLDPFGAHISQMPYLILLWGNGRFFVREKLEAPVRPGSLRYSHFIVIQKA